MAEIITTLSIQPIPPSHRWMHSMPTIYIFVLIDVMWLVKIYIGWWSWSRAEPAHKPCLQYCYFVTRIVLRELCFARTKRGAQSSLPPPTANIWRSQETPATEPTCILSLSLSNKEMLQRHCFNQPLAVQNCMSWIICSSPVNNKQRNNILAITVSCGMYVRRIKLFTRRKKLFHFITALIIFKKIITARRLHRSNSRLFGSPRLIVSPTKV
jgi:hypothetical protein